MTNLIPKQDGIIYVFDMPEASHYGVLYADSYQREKESAISNAVRCEDQEKAKELIIDTFPKDWNLGEIEVDHPYPIPGLRFEVKEVEEFPGFDHTSYPTFEKVAVLHEEPKWQNSTKEK